MQTKPTLAEMLDIVRDAHATMIEAPAADKALAFLAICAELDSAHNTDVRCYSLAKADPMFFSWPEARTWPGRLAGITG